MAKESLNSTEVRDMLLAVADKIIEAEPILSEADRQLGDGDHGIGMERGMNAVKEKLNSEEPDEIGKVFMNMGMAMMSSMGGASGAIFGTVFRAGGKAIKGCEAFTSAEAATFFKAAAEGVMERGGAKPGDKTMIDALVPAAEKAAEVTDQPLNLALAAIADAAEAGKEASKEMIATMGRAKTLGEKSIGKADAGACSVAIIVATMRDYVA
ncbi:MAG: dihydroxyacetone kinase subunit DhaL [Verrucomicrobiales bacterium]|nr:dihydroxyacetone kinase subunit DhaL [Verrucomicrobiales bacterium]